MVARGSVSVGNENALSGGVPAGATTLIPAARALSAVVIPGEGTTLLEIGLAPAG